MREVGHASLGWRVAFAVTLTVSMGIGPFVIGAMGALSPLIVPDLGLSRTELGSLATVAFGMAAATSVLGGRQADVLGGRTVLFGVFAAGGTAAIVMASAPALPWLWVGALIAGISMGVANPVTNALVAEHIPAGRQGLQIGMKQSGPPMAHAFIGFTLPPLAVAVGWRGSVLVGVVLAAAGMVLLATIVPRSHGGSGHAKTGTASKVLPMVWWLAALTFLVGIASQAVLVYVPLYAFERVGLAAANAGMTAGATGTAGMLARIIWGRLSERWGSPILALASIVSLAFVALVLILASEYVGAVTLWPGLVLFGSSALATNAVVMLVIVREVGRGALGRSSGVIGIGFFLGYMTGPVAFGALVDLTDSYTIGWAVVALMCALSLVLLLAWKRSAGGSSDEE